MFIPSTRRAVHVAVMCIVFASVLLTSSQFDWEHDVLSSMGPVKNGSLDTHAAASVADQKPFWTTDQLPQQFAYAQYATDLNYLCNAVINFNRLERFGAKHDMVLIFPDSWTEGSSPEAKAIRKLRATYPRIAMRPFDYLRISKTKASATWADSLNKFHAFELVEYSRVMIFDSDTQVLNNMDHYFLEPAAAVAVPRAYWLNERDTPAAEQVLSSHVMLIQPDDNLYRQLIKESLSSGKLDMDVVNHMFKDTAMILPHRRLALLTGEFRGNDHQKYFMPDDGEEWDPVAEVSKAYLVHFSDWPMPKPWEPRTTVQWEAALPKCPGDEVDKPGRPRCADQLIWTGFYEDYNRDKQRYCKRLV